MTHVQTTTLPGKVEPRDFIIYACSISNELHYADHHGGVWVVCKQDLCEVDVLLAKAWGIDPEELFNEQGLLNVNQMVNIWPEDN